MISKQSFESLYEMQKKEKNAIYENTNMHTYPIVLFSLEVSNVMQISKEQKQ